MSKAGNIDLFKKVASGEMTVEQAVKEVEKRKGRWDLISLFLQSVFISFL